MVIYACVEISNIQLFTKPKLVATYVMQFDIKFEDVF